jgi:hypothetical protein
LQKLLCMFETALEELAGLAVPFTEFGFNLLQQSAHFVFGERHNPGADFLCASLIGWIERANQNAGGVGAQNKAGAMNRNRGHGLENTI